MSKTIVINKLGYVPIDDIDQVFWSDINHDYREVTECCQSEDFIPSIYAVRCALCHEWIDSRFGHRKEDRYVCETCQEEIIAWRGTIPSDVDLSPLSHDELGGGAGKGDMDEKV
jgi:hypothetical protein